MKITVLERAPASRLANRSSSIAITLGLALSTLLSGTAHAGVFASADGRTDSYLLLHEGGFIYEVPDCAHSEFGPHITQQYDDELGEYAFAFHLHAAFDNDRCIVFDRQRTEIATFQSKALKDDIRTYQWRFKLDEEFFPSTFWNHIFQIRHIDPIPGGNPIFTISTLFGEKEEMLFYQDVGNGMQVLFRTPLSEFKGRWIDAYVRAKFSSSGFVEVKLKSALDDAVLLDWRRDEINLWPSDNTMFTIPKWGNYRSLEGEGPLRDEVILYSDFCVAEEDESCEMLKMFNQLQARITPAAFRFSNEISIDPFPTGQSFLRNAILGALRREISTTGSASPPARQPTTERPTGESLDARAELNETSVIDCRLVNKWTPATNPFAKASDCMVPAYKLHRYELRANH